MVADLSLRELGRAILRDWLFVVAMCAFGLILAAIYLANTGVTYPTEIVLAPPINSDQSSNSSSSLGAAASFLGIRENTSNSEFARFRLLLTAPPTAELLEQRLHIMRKIIPGWDSRQHRWHIQPRGLIGTIKATVSSLLGRHKSRIPTAAVDLSSWLSNALNITNDPQGFLHVEIQSGNPPQAENILLAVVKAANDILRRSAQKRAQLESTYLENKLKTVTNSDQRSVLIDLLSKQEQELVLSNSDVSYAAEILSPPVTRYDEPKPSLSLIMVLGMIFGFVTSLFVITIREAINYSQDIRTVSIVASILEWALIKWRRISSPA